MKHLADRRDDWAGASDEEWVHAILSVPRPTDPFFINYAQRQRPEAVRRALHADMGGYLGAPARRWLRGQR
jgi:hypothetical protein